MKVKMQDGGLLLTAENALEASSLAKITHEKHSHSLNIDGMNHSITSVDTKDDDEKQKLAEQNAKTQAQEWKDKFKLEGREKSLSGGFTPGGGSGFPATTGAQAGTPGSSTVGGGAAAEGVYDRNARPASAGTTEVGGVNTGTGPSSEIERTSLGETANSPTAVSSPNAATAFGGPNNADLDRNVTGQDNTTMAATGIGGKAETPGGKVPDGFQKKPA